MAIPGVITRQDLTDKLSIQQMDNNFMQITSSIEFRATTGSNVFIGDETISGSLTVTGSAQFGLTSSFNHLYATGARAQLRVDSGNAPSAMLLGSITASNYVSDNSATGQGVPLGGVYHTNGILRVKTGFSQTSINLSSITSLNYANDAAAQSAGLDIGGLYHTNGVLKIRLT
jgi:hypothetical protein